MQENFKKKLLLKVEKKSCNIACKHEIHVENIYSAKVAVEPTFLKEWRNQKGQVGQTIV